MGFGGGVDADFVGEQFAETAIGLDRLGPVAALEIGAHEPLVARITERVELGELGGGFDGKHRFVVSEPEVGEQFECGGAGAAQPLAHWGEPFGFFAREERLAGGGDGDGQRAECRRVRAGPAVGDGGFEGCERSIDIDPGVGRQDERVRPTGRGNPHADAIERGAEFAQECAEGTGPCCGQVFAPYRTGEGFTRDGHVGIEEKPCDGTATGAALEFGPGEDGALAFQQCFAGEVDSEGIHRKVFASIRQGIGCTVARECWRRACRR